MSKKSIYLIDGHSQLFKAFFAIRRLTAPDGTPTNAVFGFAQIINRIITEFSPEYLCVCFDLPGKTFRNDLYPEYKAHRPPAPEDLNIQTPIAKRFVQARGVRAAEMEDFESDDLLVTLAKQAVGKGYHAYIVSADKDLLQVVSENISVVKMSKSKFEVIDPARVEKEYGVPPSLMTDFQGLVGDSSDNIPGVPSIGPKTAPKLLKGYASLEEMFENLQKIKNPKQREKLEAHREDAFLSKRLATLRDDVPLDFSVEDCAFDDKPNAELLAFYEEMGFDRLREATARALGTAPDGEAPASPEEAERRADAVTPVTKTQIIWTESELRDVADRIRKAGRFAFDTETTSPDAMRAQLVGISLSWEEGHGVYIPVGHETDLASGEAAREQLTVEKAREILGPLFEDESLERVAQNAKYDQHVLERHGFVAPIVRFDTMVASYLADPTEKHGLKTMAERDLGITMQPIIDLIGSGRNQITMAQVPVEKAAPYAAADADLTLRLVAPLGRRLKEAGLERMFEEIEMPLVSVLQRMERRGIRIDPGHFSRLATEIDERLEEMSGQAQEMAGKAFNLDSPKQLAEVLFDDLGLPAKKRGQKSGALSTDMSVLEELSEKHPLPKLMLAYRTWKKLKSTYVDTLPKLIHPDSGRIHTTFNQTITATGRLSSSDPNLQNIPVRTPLGRKVREGFLPSRDGRVLLAADYSQIELRILAHVSEESALIDAFAEDEDIHALTASKIFAKPLSEISPEERAQAKTVNFGVIYGMSPKRLSGQLGISMGKAAAFIKDYFAAYPKVKEWTRLAVERAREKKYSATLSGRRRYLPDLESRSHQVRANAERIAVNTPIQGTAADMIKVAMLRLDERLAQEKPEAEMLLQVHDELIFDVPGSESQAVADIVAEEMIQALPLSVPLKVDVKIGRNWAEC